MNWKAEDKYADIIRLPHHVSRKHPQMSMADRAAHSSPLLHWRDMTPQSPKPPASWWSYLFWMNP